MEVGIVGLPNVGKSTLFNALTAAGAHAANYPFATIEPNIGVVSVPEPRLHTINEHIQTQKVLPAPLRVVDIAGIVKGASQGEGLGNKFLSHIREVDAIAHIVRCFEKAPGGEDIIHVEGSIDPIRDIETIETELIIADLQVVENALTKAQRNARTREPEAITRVELLEALLPGLEAGKTVRQLIAEGVVANDPDQRKILRGLGLITAKKVLFIANVDEDDPTGVGPLATLVRERAEAEGMMCVPVCAKIEAELVELDEADRQEMLESIGLTEPALDAVAHACFALLGLHSFFTVGPKQIRAWPVPIGTTAPQAAGAIHTDFERGFIRAEIYSVNDLVEYKTEKAIREAGKLRVEGKAYVMRDGDVTHFLFNT